MNIEKIEYRVRPVTRYIVTRYEDGGDGPSIRERGEYDNAETAHAVGYALAKAEHERLGFPPGDMRIIYPEPYHPPGQIGSGGEDQFPLSARPGIRAA